MPWETNPSWPRVGWGRRQTPQPLRNEILASDQRGVHHKDVWNRQYQVFAHPFHTGAFDENFTIIWPVDEMGIHQVKDDCAGNDAQ